MSAQTDWPGAYASIARYYVQAGWLGALPLPPMRKDPVPAGFTGWRHFDTDPTSRDLDRWLAEQPNGNIALRMPRNVIGIDVDAYEGKPGAESLRTAEEKWGQLPPTWRTTSRHDDPVSGIRYYQVPEGMKWPNTVGPGIEMIHRGHRYAVAPPSIHPDTGQHYMWVSPTGEAGWEFPSPSSLPWLPDAWLTGLTEGVMRDTATARSEVPEHASGWLTAGEPCRAVLGQLERLSEALSAKGSRHDSTRDLMLAVLFLGQQGHEGVGPAIETMRSRYVAEVGQDRNGDVAMEWTRMLDGAFQIVAASPRETEVCRGEECGTITKLEPPAALSGVVIDPQAARQAEEVDLEAHEDAIFWDQRPELRHIKDFARARYANPWAALGAVLVRVVCQIPPTVVIPPIVGGAEAALNLYLVIAGRSGGGKQAAEGVAEYAFVYGARQVVLNIGSGEGIPKAYRKPVKATQDDEAPSDGWIERSILWRSSEIDNIAAQKNRSGSTTMNVIRDAWNGDQLGFAYANAEKKVDVPARSYRAGLIVGAQPDRVEAILGQDEVDGGTPQRFLWMPAQDPSLPDIDALSPEEQEALLDAEAPAPRHWVKPKFEFGFTSAGTGNRHVVIPKEVSRVIKIEAIKRNRGSTEALDGHALLNRLKVACALAFLAGRPDVKVEDWELAGVVMAKSDSLRAQLAARLDEKRKTAKRRALMDDIEVNLEGEDHAKALTVKKVKASLRRYLADGEWHSGSALRKKLSATANAVGIAPRDVFEDAIKDLINDRAVRSKPSESNRGGLLYSLDR